MFCGTGLYKCARSQSLVVTVEMPAAKKRKLQSAWHDCKEISLSPSHPVSASPTMWGEVTRRHPEMLVAYRISVCSMLCTAWALSCPLTRMTGSDWHEEPDTACPGCCQNEACPLSLARGEQRLYCPSYSARQAKVVETRMDLCSFCIFRERLSFTRDFGMFPTDGKPCGSCQLSSVAGGPGSVEET